MPAPHSSNNDEHFYSLLNEKIGRPEFDREIKALNDDLSEIKQELKKEIQDVKTDVKDMREKDIEALKQALIKNQQAGFQRIIYIQSAVLLAVLSGVIALIIKVLGG